MSRPSLSGLPRMKRVVASLALVLASEAVASADVTSNELSITSFDPENAVAPETSIEGPGIKVGEGTVLHPVFGMETGVVSNVFYTETDSAAAGMLRLLAQIGAGSLSSARLAPTEGDENGAGAREGDFAYKASLRASYDLMLSGNEAIRSTGGLGVGALLRGMVNPNGSWSFGFDEQFDRLIRAANFETDANTNRDINNLQLKLIYHPVDHTVGGYIYYSNTVDVFERSDIKRRNDRDQTVLAIARLSIRVSHFGGTRRDASTFDVRRTK